MARILIVTSGLTGIFNATSRLISLLANNGHSVSSASPGPDLSPKHLFFSHVVLDPLMQKSAITLPSDMNARGFAGFVKRNIFRSRRRKEAVDIIEPKDFLPLVESLSPDLLIIDIEMHEYIIQSFSTKVPIILLNQFFSVWTSSSLPDIQSETIVGRGMAGSKLGMSLAFIKLLVSRKFGAVKRSIISGGLTRKEVFRELAKKWNFPSDFIGYDLWPGPFLYDKIPVFNMTLEAMDFPHTKRKNLHYIGPMVDEERVDRPAETSNSYSLEDAFQKAEKSAFQIVYCSVGTLSKGDEEFLLNVVKAFRELPEWILILSIGKQLEEKNFESNLENVYVFSHVPQLEVLSKASVALVHGGVHTINECLLYQVPMLVYSGKKSDQNGCAARLAYHGLGYRCDKDLDQKDDIRDKILAISKDKKIKNNLGKMHQLITEFANGHRIHDLIEKALIG